MDKIRVAHLVNPTFGSVFSGHTHFLFSLLSGWRDEDISLDLFGSLLKPTNMNSGDRVYRLPQGALWSSPKRQDRWGRIHWSFELLRLLIAQRQNYDLIHIHALNWGAFLSPLVLHALGKKVIYTMSLFGNDNPGYILKKPRGKMQVALMRQFDGMIGLSPALVDDARRNGIRNVICLPNFLAIPQLEESIEYSRFKEAKDSARSKLHIHKEGLVLLFVGSIIRRKGVDIIIDAFIELAPKYPSLILILVGPQRNSETTGVDEVYVNILKGKIRFAGLQDRVTWEGMIRDQSKMVDYYRAADLFVFPTRNEGSPNVLAEAMAASLPVIASMLPGITDEVVSNGESGYLVEPERSDKLREAINCLLMDDTTRFAMGVNARRIALEKFSFDAYCQKLRKYYLNLYSGIDKGYD